MYGQTATIENWPYPLRRAERPATALPGPHAASKPRNTTFVEQASPSFRRASVSLTAFALDVIEDDEFSVVATPDTPVGDDPPELPVELRKARDARLELLARKHEGAASVEDVARIHILTARLRRLDPRVTAEERLMAERLVESAEQTAARLAELKARYGV